MARAVKDGGKTVVNGTPPIPGTYAPRQYTYADVASLFRVSEVTVKRWVKHGRILSPNYIGATARWTEEQFDQLKAGPCASGTYVKQASPRALTARYTKKKKEAHARTKKKAGAK